MVESVSQFVILRRNMVPQKGPKQGQKERNRDNADARQGSHNPFLCPILFASIVTLLFALHFFVFSQGDGDLGF